MARHTGFYHQAESHLFDLVPELYCADYLLGWFGEAVLEEYGKERFGEDGCLDSAMGRWLKTLWRQGFCLGLDAFLQKNELGKLRAEPLLRRWRNLTAARHPHEK
jgi:hypothetical protein